MFEFSNNNCTIKCKKCSKLTTEAHGVFLVSLFLTLNIFDTLFSCFSDELECVNAGWNTFIALAYIYLCVSDSYLGALLHLRQSSLQQQSLTFSCYDIPIFFAKSSILDVTTKSCSKIHENSNRYWLRGEPLWLSATLGKYQKLTLLDAVKIHFQRFFRLRSL